MRKTFHYPAEDSEDDDTPRDMDEEGMWDHKQISKPQLVNSRIRAREAHQ